MPVPYRVGAPGRNRDLAAQHRLLGALAARLAAYGARLSAWDLGVGLTPGYFLLPSALNSGVDVRYVPTEAPRPGAVWGPARDRGQDDRMRAALRAAERLLRRDGWAVSVVPAGPDPVFYAPALHVAAGPGSQGEKHE